MGLSDPPDPDPPGPDCGVPGAGRPHLLKSFECDLLVSSNNQVGGEKQGMEQSQVRHGAPALLWLAVRPQLPVWIQMQVRLG